MSSRDPSGSAARGPGSRHRRRLGVGAVLLGLAWSTLSGTLAQEADPPDVEPAGSLTEDAIFDHHVHVLSPGLLRDWKSLGMRFAGPDENYTDVDGILEAHRLSGAFLVSMAHLYASSDLDWSTVRASAEGLRTPEEFELSRVARENDFIGACARVSPERLVGFFSVHPLREYALEEMQRCRGVEGLSGLKLHLPSCGVSLDDPEHLGALDEVFSWAAEHDTPILVHLFPPAPEGDVEEMARAFWEELVAPHPNLEVYLAHLGAAGGFNSTSEEVLEQFLQVCSTDPGFAPGRIHFDLSGAILAAPVDGIPATSEERCAQLASWMRKVGLARFVFASDYPVFSPLQVRGVLRDKLPLQEDERSELWRVQAARWKDSAAKSDEERVDDR